MKRILYLIPGLLIIQSANAEVPIGALFVANVKFRIESRLDPADLKFDNLYLGLDFAF